MSTGPRGGGGGGLKATPSKFWKGDPPKIFKKGTPPQFLAVLMYGHKSIIFSLFTCGTKMLLNVKKYTYMYSNFLMVVVMTYSIKNMKSFK